MSKLLQFYDKSQYCIYTGTGLSINKPHVQDNDICVVKNKGSSSCGLIEEVHHMTVMWCSDRSCDHYDVSYGTVGTDVLSDGASLFCTSNDSYRKSTIAILSVSYVSVVVRS